MKCTRVVGFCVAVLLLSGAEGRRKREGEGRSRPRQLTANNVTSASAHVRWLPPRPMDADSVDCPVAKYQVRMKTEGSTQSQTWKVDGSRTYMMLQDLSPSTTYNLRLVGLLCEGQKSYPSRWLIFTTQGDQVATPDTGSLSEASVPGKPTYVRTRTFTDSVIVSWHPPEETGVMIRGYICGYGEGVPDVNWKYVDASRRNVTITKLKSATQYVVSLRAYNNVGKGPVVYELVYTRERNDGPTASPFTPPSDLRAKVLSPNTAWLQWTDPSLGRSQTITDNRYYNVHYQAMPNGKTLSVIVKALRVVIYDLVPGTQYEFKVRTVKDSATSPFSDSVFNRTFETAPGSAPRSLTLEQGDLPAEVQVKWRSPRQPNGDITGYIVLYSVESNLPDREWYVKAIDGDSLESNIAPMAPNTTYFFKIQARNSNGFGPLSDVVAFTTPVLRDEPASAPRDVMATAGNYATEILLSWREPKTIQSPINGYVVYYTWSLDNPSAEWLVKQVRDMSTDTIITGLRPNIVYYFKLVAQTNRGLGQVSEAVHCYTRVVPTPVPHPRDESMDSEEDPSNEVAPQANGNKTIYPRTQATAISLTQTNVTASADSGIIKRDQDGTFGVWDDSQIVFQTQVQYFVNIYITWPQTPGASCDITSDVTGYAIRYYRDEGLDSEVISDQDYITQNLRQNFVVLSNLIPDSVYHYQVKYLSGQGVESDWSQKATVTSYYQPPT